jgi:plastocyanin
MIASRPVWSLGLMAVLCSGLSGCSSLPQTTRTAAIHDVKIEEKLSADSLLVQPGDEIRWVNHRKLQALVDIPNLKSDDLSCQRGFSNWMGSLGESVELKANETASLCFKKPAVINYNVRAETSLGGGRQVLPGVIKVGSPLPQ